MAEDIYRKRKEQEKTVNPVKENKNPEEAKLLEQKKAEFDSAMNELKEAIEKSKQDQISFAERRKRQLQQKKTASGVDDTEEPAGKETVSEAIADYSVEKRNNRRVLLIAGIIGLIMLSIFVSGTIITRKIEQNSAIDQTSEITEPENSAMPPELKDEWLTNKAINPDFVGSIKFDSGLIDLPFVQAKDVYDRNGKPYTFYTEEGQLVENVDEYTGNDVYIWTNWKTGEYDHDNEGGSVFMDFRNNLKDQNLIIYGHHFARDWDPSGSKQFTPLDALLEEENYETNKTFSLILDNEKRDYLITNVFTIEIDNDYELNIMRRNMNEDYSGNPDPDFFKGFIEFIDKVNKYQISEKLSPVDNIVTLVTCMEHQPELRQIVIAKETKRTTYEQ